jgi:hypothetical protein
MVRQSLGPELLRVPFLLYASLHRSAWKVNSAKLNFRYHDFCELRRDGVLGSSHLAPVTGIMLTVEGQPANPKRAGSLPYPGSA